MCGEGGIVTTNNLEYAKKIRSFRQHGMTEVYEYDHLGFNYRMSDLHAAIAVEQVKKIDMFNRKRLSNALHFNKGLKGITGIDLPIIKEDRTHAFHQYTIRINQKSNLGRDQILKKIRSNGIGAGVYYPKPLHIYPHISKLGYKIGDFPNAEQASREVISIPVHPDLTAEDIRHIVKTIKDINE